MHQLSWSRCTINIAALYARACDCGKTDDKSNLMVWAIQQLHVTLPTWCKSIKTSTVSTLRHTIGRRKSIENHLRDNKTIAEQEHLNPKHNKMCYLNDLLTVLTMIMCVKWSVGDNNLYKAPKPHHSKQNVWSRRVWYFI